MSDYSPNPAFEAPIEVKTLAAIREAGHSFTSLMEAELAALLPTVEFSDEEKRYMAEQHIYRLACAVIGRRMVQALDEHCRVPREDMIRFLTAYFEADAAGEIPELA